VLATKALFPPFHSFESRDADPIMEQGKPLIDWFLESGIHARVATASTSGQSVLPTPTEPVILSTKQESA